MNELREYWWEIRGSDEEDIFDVLNRLLNKSTLDAIETDLAPAVAIAVEKEKIELQKTIDRLQIKLDELKAVAG